MQPLDLERWDRLVVASVYSGLRHTQVTTKHVRKQAITMPSSEMCTDPQLQALLTACEAELELVSTETKTLIDSIPVATPEGRLCIAAASTACELEVASPALWVCCIQHACVPCLKVQFFSNLATQDTQAFNVSESWIRVLEAVMVVANHRTWIQQLVQASVETITNEVVQGWKQKVADRRDVFNTCMELIKTSAPAPNDSASHSSHADP